MNLKPLVSFLLKRASWQLTVEVLTNGEKFVDRQIAAAVGEECLKGKNKGL